MQASQLFHSMRQETVGHFNDWKVPHSMAKWLLGKYDKLDVPIPDDFEAQPLEAADEKAVYSAMATGELTGEPIEGRYVFLYASARAIQLMQSARTDAEIKADTSGSKQQKQAQDIQTMTYHFIAGLYRELGLEFR